ncbi:MAG TPA: PAS domain-containing protein [Opitutaceae bacterium]|nr:PAS domain-containing protein [Opitutaceae bacterium]
MSSAQYPPSAPAASDAAAVDRTLVLAFLESVPDFVHFKDRDGRFIAVSRSKLRRNGLASPEQIVGKTDFDFFSAANAQRAKDDEDEVMRTGVPILNKLEHVKWADGRETWSLINKLPLRDESGAVVGTFGLTKDITESKRMEQALEQTRRELLEATRQAGMAEVATGVLHNVGNVLNSLNVAATVIANGLRDSRTETLARVTALLREHERAGDLGAFLTTDPRGRKVPELLESLAGHFTAERERLRREVEELQRSVDHIKDIVAMQQAYATVVGVSEPLDPAQLMEDALRINSTALVRHDVSVERAFTAVPAVLAERGKVLQVLVNFIRNAKYACDEGGGQPKRIILRIEGAEPGRVRLAVEDNGVGIPPENLTRIFQHGFTTRANGHGFGLHSSALAAREMKGSVTAHSAGAGQGATFVLELPAAG